MTDNIFNLLILIIICYTLIQLLRDWKGRKSFHIELLEMTWKPIVTIIKEFRSRNIAEFGNAIMVIVWSIITVAFVVILVLKSVSGGKDMLLYFSFPIICASMLTLSVIISIRYVVKL